MNNPTLIRAARADDYPSASALLNICFEDENIQSGVDPYIEQSIERLATGRNTLFVMTKSDALIGCLQVDDFRTAIFKLAIHPNHRGNDYGKLLMQAAEQRARDLRWPVMLLGIFGNNPRLVSYYQEQGYRLTGEEKFGNAPSDGTKPPPRFAIMEKRL